MTASIRKTGTYQVERIYGSTPVVDFGSGPDIRFEEDEFPDWETELSGAWKDRDQDDDEDLLIQESSVETRSNSPTNQYENVLERKKMADVKYVIDT